jgi:hypothetical protein
MYFVIDDSNAVEAFECFDANAQDITVLVVFTNAKQFELASKDWSLTRFVDIWNDMAGGPPLNLKPVKKFENRVTAIARLWNAIRRLGNTTAEVEETANAAPTLPDVAPEPVKTDTESIPTPKAARAKKAPREAKAPRKPTHPPRVDTPTEHTPRVGSKMELVIGMLKRKNGASVPEIQAKTDWQPHTTRAFISATLGKKLGLHIETTKDKESKEPRRYFIAA